MFLAIIVGLVVGQGEALAKPKYGPAGKAIATPLSKDHEYFSKNIDSPFWQIMPFYVSQLTECSCSVASAATVLNAVWAPYKKSSEDRYYSEKTLLELSLKFPWKKRIQECREGVSLAEMKGILLELPWPKKVKIRVGSNLSNDLKDFEEKRTSFLIVNFLQSTLTDDAAVGHFAVVGAYDQVRRRVLILDPDRDWYEPYWVSEERLSQALRTTDPTSKEPRGYLVGTLLK